MQYALLSLSLGLSLVSSVSGHACPWDKSMWGINITDGGNFPRDPLMRREFDDWWFHNHLHQPPPSDAFLEFPAGGEKFVEITCDKGASSEYTSNSGGDIRKGNDVCPGRSTLEYHTKSQADTKGCAFAIAYTPPSQVKSIKPEDFTIFTVNHTCVWERFTKFEIPKDMPACPEGGCTCAWFWIHSSDAGSQQIYMNGYQCNITGATSTVPLAQPQVPRRCGAITDNPEINKPADPSNCTYGAKAPMYWLQNSGNNMFENPQAAPFYNDLYAYGDGAQNDIFVNSVLPEMSWPGAPKTGQLKAVRGLFNGKASDPANAASDPSQNASSVTSSSVSSSATSSQHPGSTQVVGNSGSKPGSSSLPSGGPVNAAPAPTATEAQSESKPESSSISGSSASPPVAHQEPQPSLGSGDPTNSPPAPTPTGSGSDSEPASTSLSSSEPSSPVAPHEQQPSFGSESAPPAVTSSAHPKNCKCHKCKKMRGEKTVYVTETVTVHDSEETNTISPKDASSIISHVTPVPENAAAAEPSPSDSSPSCPAKKAKRAMQNRSGSAAKHRHRRMVQQHKL